MLSSKGWHMTKVMFWLGAHMTCLTMRNDFEVLFWEIHPDLLSDGPVFFKNGFTSSVTIKIFRRIKGHRRLILNLVTKIRNLKLKSITAWRGWLESRKVVLKQEEIFQRHFIEAHSTKARPPETLTKSLQCSSNWAMITHTLAGSQFFDLFETWNEDNVNCISTRYDVSGCNSKLSNYKLTKKNKGL